MNASAPLVHGFNGGSNPLDQKMYFNKRAEVWGLAKDWLEAGASIPDDPELAADLTGITFDYSAVKGQRHGSIILESKDEMKRRGQRFAVLKFMMSERKILANSRAKVFPFEGVAGRVSVETKRAAKRAGLPEIHFHSLRHTFGSWAVMNGNDLGAVQRLMGHKSPRQTARYAHLSPAYMQQQMDTLNNAFTGVIPLLNAENSGDAVGTIEGANVSLPVTSSHKHK